MSKQLLDIKSSEWGFDIDNLGNVKEGLNDIKQCVYIILTTQKGTDRLRPNFGCSAFDYVDKPVNIAIPNMKKAILDGLNEFEKRIEKIKISHVLDGEKISFIIKYGVKNTILTDELKATYGITNS